MIVPPISEALLDYLDHIYPNEVPNITDTDREVWAKVGEQRVLKKLTHEYERQRHNVLKES